MKSARFACSAALIILSSLVRAQADTSAPKSDADDIASLQDPNGVPMSISNPQQKQKPPTPEQLEAQRQAAEYAAKEREWFIKGYINYLHSSPNGMEKDDSGNFIDKVSSDPQMAQMAGLPYIDRSDEENKQALRATPRTATMTLRQDPETKVSPLAPLSLPSVVPPPLPGLVPQASNNETPLMTGDNWQAKYDANTFASKRTSANGTDDSTSESRPLDMPGQTAAQSNQQLDPTLSSLAFDLTDDQPAPSLTDPNAGKMALPMKTNQAPPTVKPTPPGQQQAQAQAAPKVLPVPEEKPFTLPPMAPVGRAIPDPHDVFGR